MPCPYVLYLWSSFVLVSFETLGSEPQRPTAKWFAFYIERSHRAPRIAHCSATSLVLPPLQSRKASVLSPLPPCKREASLTLGHAVLKPRLGAPGMRNFQLGCLPILPSHKFVFWRGSSRPCMWCHGPDSRGTSPLRATSRS